MLIDWFTVIAQIINFLILVWLLKRFLYKPILCAIDEREKRIAAELEKAKATEADAKKERDTFQQKNEALEKQRVELLRKAKEEAGAEKHLLLEAARTEQEALRTKQRQTLKNERDVSEREIVERTQSEVFAISRKVLKDLASESLEDRMVETFNRRLYDLKPEEKAKLKSGKPALVRTAFELSSASRTTLEKTLKATVQSDMNIGFEIVPDLVSGIELTTNGNKVCWSIGNYLTSLEESIQKPQKGVERNAD